MSIFTKKYYLPKSLEFLSLSWEQGYRNIRVVYKNRLISEIQSPSQLMKGIQLSDDELGRIKIKFTTERPRKLEIKINGRKCKTINNAKLSYDFTGLITIFSTLAVASGISTIITAKYIPPSFTFGLILLIVNIAVTAFYAVCSYVMSKRKHWGYFAGTGVFTFFSLLEILLLPMNFSFMNIVVFIFRIGFIAYIYSQFKKVRRDKKTKPTINKDVLDDL